MIVPGRWLAWAAGAAHAKTLSESAIRLIPARRSKLVMVMMSLPKLGLAGA